MQVTKKAAMLSVFHLANFTGLRSTAIASTGVKTNFLGRMQKITAGNRGVILPQSPQRQQTTTFQPSSKRNQKLTHRCGLEAQIKKRRVSGNGQTALPGALKLGWKTHHGTVQKHKTVWSSSEMGGYGEIMIAQEGTISCAAKSFVVQVGISFKMWMNEDTNGHKQTQLNTSSHL